MGNVKSRQEPQVIGKICLYIFLGLSAGLPGSLYGYGPCDADREKLCESQTHKETEQNCLHRHKAKTSPQCQEFLKTQEPQWQKLTQSWSKVLDTCKKELGTHCKEISGAVDKKFENMKEAQVCLMVARDELGETCKKEINRHIGEFQPHIQPL